MRRRFRRRIDRVGYWLIRHRCHRAAIALWRALGMWNSNNPGE